MNFLQRWLVGPDRLPDQYVADLAGEVPVLLERDLRGSVTYRDYRTPRQFTARRKQGTSGTIAVTPTRLLVWARATKHVDVARSGAARASVQVATDGPGRICFAYDASAADPAHSGRVEVRLRTARAAEIAALIDDRG